MSLPAPSFLIKVTRPAATQLDADDPGTRGRALRDQSYLIRYGVMNHVGRFPSQTAHESSLERGQLVVLQTDRGVELGEVLVAVDGTPVTHGGVAAESSGGSEGDGLSAATADGTSRVLRIAGPDDLLRSRRAAESRVDHFSLCQRVLEQADWPWEVVDVEPLLDGRSTVIHYLGPHRIDVATLRARFRTECDLDVVLEPVGTDLDTEYSADPAHEEQDVGGACGSCGSGGGCGSALASEHGGHDQHSPDPATSGCGSKTAHSGCSSCGISRLLADRKRTPV